MEEHGERHGDIVVDGTTGEREGLSCLKSSAAQLSRAKLMAIFGGALEPFLRDGWLDEGVSAMQGLQTASVRQFESAVSTRD